MLTAARPLSAGKPDASIPDGGIHPLRQSAHKFVQLRHLQHLFNPRIVSQSVAYEAVEGCLSLYGARTVTRYKNIKVEWKTRTFQTRMQTFTGNVAQIIQHEIDHCNGILI